MGARIATAALLVALALPAAALAQDCPRTSLGDIEDEVMCVACGVTLELATDAPQAQRERQFINELIADCKTKDEVKTALTAEFGDEVLAVPEDEGFDLAAYIVPLLVLLGGLVAVALAWVRWRGGRRDAAPAAAGAAEEESRLDRDMERYEL